MNQNYRTLRVFAEGVRIPVARVSRTQQSGQPLKFTVSMPATPVGQSVLPGTYMTVFVRRENPEGGVEFSLFAEGRVQKISSQTNARRGRQISLQCAGIDHDWIDLPMGLDVGSEFGWPRAQLMNFFQGTSARQDAPEISELEDAPTIAASRRSRMFNALRRTRNGAADPYFSIARVAQEAMAQKGIVVGLAEILVSAYQFSPIARRDYNATKFAKRIGLVNNQAISRYMKRQFNLDLMQEQVRNLPDDVTVQQLMNYFLQIAMHEYVSIGSPYFSRAKEEGDEKRKEAEKEGLTDYPEWTALEGDEKIDAALKDPYVKGFLDAIAYYEVGPQSVGNEIQRQQSYVIGYGGRAYDSSVRGEGKHPWEDKDNVVKPRQVAFEDGSYAAIYPDTGDRIPEEGATYQGKTVKEVSISTAVGRYQIIEGTWEDMKKKSDKLTRFDSAGQDRAAAMLLERRGVLDEVARGNAKGALGEGSTGAAGEWASLPSASGEGAFADDDASGNQQASDDVDGFIDTFARMTAQYDQKAAGQIRELAPAFQVGIESSGILPSCLFKPNFHFEPPPVSNVIFGGEVTNLQVSDDFTRNPTRLMVAARPEWQSNQQAGSKNAGAKMAMHFAPRHLDRIIDHLRGDNKFSDIGLTPGIQEDVEAYKKKIMDLYKEQGEVLNPEAFVADVLPAEYRPYAEKNDLMKRILEGAAGGVEDDLLMAYTYQELFGGINSSIRSFPFYVKGGGPDNDAASIYAQYQFALLSRMGRNASIQTKLNLDLVPGFTVAVYDESTGWVVGEPFVITDTVTADGSATTNIQLGRCKVLSQYLNPYHERIHRTNESEFAKLDEDGAVQNPVFFDESFSADQIGDTVYQPVFGSESIVDYAKRYSGEEKISLKRALEVLQEAYDREGGQDWLESMRFRDVATEGQMMQQVLEAWPADRLVQESDDDIPTRDQIYDQYDGVFSAREVPDETTSGRGVTPAFVSERRLWAKMYRDDLQEREHALAEAKGETTGTRIPDWGAIRDEVIEEWKNDLKTFQERFAEYNEAQEEAGQGDTRLFRDPFFRMGIEPPIDLRREDGEEDANPAPGPAQ